MLSLFLASLNGWAAWSLARTKTQMDKDGRKVPWYLVPLGVANVLFCMINLMFLFGG